MTRVEHCALVLIVVIAAVGSYGQVTFDRIVNAAKEPQNWLTYSGDYAGRRFSPLDQINTTNARSLVAKWVYQTAATGKFETTPLVVDGILYATGQDDRAFALDARTGRPIWLYQHQLPSDIRPCCGRRKWRFYTVPGPGEPGHETWEGDSWQVGGAPAWITGVYDAVS